MTLVIVSGFEPLAYRLGGGRSIQLSYTIVLTHVIISQTRKTIKTSFCQHYNQRYQDQVKREAIDIFGL